ncbi:Alpha/beta hydrolase fold-1,Alpha/Beta hydrolase fold [Cinara cedri]|uniref:Alpha/beta hydrolase fold-1,Alpha/Beta hydrolase fold n=1 Tax=Cinara cedri TaxID=506608 RepID=A0A5E4NHX2_9HEMI|nr:Alpha/beta hydrolase fold-1,Alpha/Beta hydrolase fold [Cinara cedri]
MSQTQSTSEVGQKPTKIKIDKYEINYSKFGNGPHALLLCPGLLGCVDNFKPIIDHFDRGKYTMVAWDPPGYGLSRPPDREFPPKILHRDADLAISLMDALHIDTYSVLGWCDGGSTALIMAASGKTAGRLRKAVVWSCKAFVTASAVELYNSRRNVIQWSPQVKQRNVEKYGMPYFQHTFNAWVDWYQGLLHRNAGEIISRRELADISVPTLILHGGQDALVPAEHALYLQQNIDNSSLEIIPEGKHLLHFTIAGNFNTIVENFLAAT